MIYHYDGTLPGLFTVFATAGGQGVTHVAIERPPYPDKDLFSMPVAVDTDLEQADRVRQAILDRLGSRALAHVRLAYLSGHPGIENNLWSYLQLGKKVGKSLNSYLAHPDVHTVLAWSRRTAREAHRMKGFVRFRKLADGTFYAPYRADTNVLPLLAPHFSRRMDRPWLLHDIRRGLGAIGDPGRVTLGEICTETPPIDAVDEPGWQRLWQTFHRAIAIETRHNPRLQRQFVPLKYRDFLVEFDQAAG